MVDVQGMTDENLAWVSREAFRSREVYELELERIFKRCWLFLGHTSQIRNKGDFFTTYMAEDSVVVTRGQDNAIHAFINSCRHRGMRVCRADRGNARHFSCPYHAWTYDTTGRLIGVPREEDGYYNELDKSQLPLHPVSRVETYNGLIFGTFDANAVPLERYLGDMRFYLDLVLDRRGGGTELIPGVHKWTMRTNWKLSCDNNAGDWYHVPVSHGSMARLNNAPAQFQDDQRRKQVCAEPGHTLVMFDGAQQAPSQDDRLGAYRAEIEEEIAARLGERRRHMRFVAGNVFPNLGWIPGSFTLRQYHPRGPGEIEVWSYCIVDAQAPPELKNLMKRAYTGGFGPSGLLEQDDGENWSGCARGATRGAVTRDQEFNYHMGLGHEWVEDDLPGQIGRGNAEVVQRGFYRRWRSELLRDDGEPVRLVAGS